MTTIFLFPLEINKFLGVYLDEHLTWKHHISFVCKQIAKSIGVLFSSRFYLSVKTKLTLYYTLIYPYITYVVTVPGRLLMYLT